ALAGGLTALALGGTACGLSPYAAVVNGQVISQQQLFSELGAIKGNSAYVTQLEKQGLPVAGDGSSTYSTQFVDDILNRQISFALVHQEVERRHLSISRSDRKLARADVVATFGGPQVFGAFSRSYQDFLVDHSADLTALESDLARIPVGEAALHRYYAAHRRQLRDVCVSLIVVTSRSEADAVETALHQGQSFSHLASTVSAIPQLKANGGQIGCALPEAFAGQLGSGFAKALTQLAAGQVSKPLHNQYGWILAEVASARQEPFSEATPAIRGALLNSSSGALLTFISHLSRHGTVEVDPSYGKYSVTKSSTQVVPPTAPPAADLVLPNGVSPASPASPAAPSAGGSSG
ncbi:MAG: peptidylprolyl isomerase, partial [Acidimicrobiales bacterium]